MDQTSPLVDQLIERLQNQEQLEMEFKECKEALSQDLWETVSAFANTQGGWLCWVSTIKDFLSVL